MFRGDFADGGETLEEFALETYHEPVSPDIIHIILVYLVDILQLWETLQGFDNR